MAVPFRQMQRVLKYLSTHLDGDVSLETLAARAGLSRFHLHRVFANTIGETPAILAGRLRLGRAAVLLLTTRQSVLDVALSCGFQSHETFCRAFQRRFAMSPRDYRKRGFAQSIDRAQAKTHALIVDQTAACLKLYHLQQQKSELEKTGMTYSITRKDIASQPVLVVRRRVKRSDIAATIGEALPHVFAYAQQHGIALAGLPFTRYLEMGPGLITMESGMRIAAGEARTSKSGDAGVMAEILPGGPVATVTHTGPYEGLPDAYAAIEEWIEAQGFVASASPWECYMTDPSEHPNPEDWKTEVFWPLRG
jgi:AraC family transcriptional regulator